MICFTADLQDEGVLQMFPVAVDQLEFPLLEGWPAWERADKPACGGGIVDAFVAGFSQKESDGFPFFGGQLKASSLDGGEGVGIGEDGANAFASEALAGCPEFFCRVLRAYEEELPEGNAGGGECRGVEGCVGVGPDDRCVSRGW